MSIYIITYDIHKGGSSDPDAIIDAIESCGGKKIASTTYVIKPHNKDAWQLFRLLYKIIDHNDTLFVAEITGEPEAQGVPYETKAFLEENL